MLLPRAATQPAAKRDGHNTSSQTAILVVVTLAIVVSLVIITYLVLKSFRQTHANPKYIPTKYLKRKWEAWNPLGIISKGNYSARLQENDSEPTLHRRSARGSTINLEVHEPAPAHVETAEAAPTAEVAVDRQTSVRSVMTLPAYSKSVRENEQILGREGDRAGIDIVLEHPETAEEEEGRREEEMDSLYQIRAQRRQEIVEQQARREERRQARARGDTAALERLRHESALRAQERDLSGAAAMIAEHQSRSRERRVSKVNYAALGVARHDGTRIRANSSDSERPLLDSAASIAGASTRPYSMHSSQSRGRSASSFVSVSDTGDEADQAPYGSAGSDFEIVPMNQAHSRNASESRVSHESRSRASSNAPPSRPMIDISADLGDRRIPSGEPPAYDGEGFEEAPPYTSPIQSRQPSSSIQDPSSTPRQPSRQFTSDTGAPMLPRLDRLPSIRIADAPP